MKNKNTNQTHFTITTTNGTRWSAKAANSTEARKNFFGTKLGLTILKIEKSRLLTAKEETELSREKAIERSR